MPRSKTDFTNFIDTHPNYFPGQYLLEDDFEVQHQYLSDRQLYHHKSLHVSGILEGLDVEIIQGKKEVNIKSGSAIDGDGNLIVCKKDASFSGFGAIATGELYIQYTQVKQLKQQEGLSDSFTRWQEVPVIQFAVKAPDSAVKLGGISIAGDVLKLDISIRAYSGVFLPNAMGNDLTLRSGGNANSNLAILNGSLSVAGDLAVTGNITGKIDTANITSGVLNSDRIPNLSADKITTGSLNVARIPNLSADKITSGTITGNLTITGNTNIGATAIGSQVKIDLSGNLHLKEFATGNLAFLQARDDTSNRDIGLRIRTQLRGTTTTIPTLVEAFTITPSGNIGVGIADPSTYKLNVQGDQFLSGILAIGDAPFTANTGGHREWMTRGIKIFWNSDNLYLGLKDEGDNRKDAVIAWGDDAADNLRFIYAGSGGAVQGSEVMKLTPSGDLSVIGNLSFGSTVRQMINLWSTNYGIGVQDSTQYFRTDSNFAWYKGGSHNDKALSAGTGGTLQMSLDSSGNLGIGTLPTRGKVQIEGFVKYGNPTGYRYVRRDGIFDNSGVYNAPYSLYVSDFIGAQEFNAFSDLRIKDIQGYSNTQNDLTTLLQIKIVDYYYKDKIANDNRPKKKVIGQEVASVYPQATSTHADTVPDILQFAVISGNWVTLGNHDLKVGEKVKILWGENQTRLFAVEAIKPDRFKISLDYTGELFVYGREVDDFHVVDYDALSMLHISATQEIYKIVKKLQEEIKQLRDQQLVSQFS